MKDPNRPWWTRSRLPLAVVFVVAVVCNLPYLSGGFAADDILFLDILKINPPPFTWWGGLWSIRDPDTWSWLDFAAFRPLWWREAGTMGTFWRPLFSFIFAGSVGLFGENAVPLHVLSLAAHGAVGVCLVLWVRRLSGRPGLALIAGLLYVTCEDHSLGVGWIATMTDMLCVLFIMLALLGHVRWLQHRRPRDLILSLLALILAFTSKESAVTAPVVMVLATFLAPQGTAEPIAWALPALRERLAVGLGDVAGWLPQGGALGLYLVLYKTLGFGGMDSLMYIDPLGNPLGFLKNVVIHAPVMWLATLSPAPPSLTMFAPESWAALAVAGVASMVLWILLLWPHRHNSLVVWAFAAYGIALLPQLSTDASERGLYFPFVGAAILLAVLLCQLRAAGPRLRRIGAWAVLLGIAIPGAIMALVMPWSMLGSFGALDAQIKSAVPHVRASPEKPVLVLNTSGLMVTFYVGGLLEHELGQPLDIHLLSSCNGIVSIERDTETSFILHADRAGWLSNMFARGVRKEPEFTVGQSYDNPHFAATVVATTVDRSDVLAVSFRLKGPIDTILFMRWDGKSFVPFELATMEIGTSSVLADTSDIWASMM